jgi:MOSC domain-containing protein YiiM
MKILSKPQKSLRLNSETHFLKGKTMIGTVIAVSKSPAHSFSKPNHESIKLLAGLGVEHDAHLGKKVQHLSRVAKDPNQPNLRQVHLIHVELLDELRERGFDVSPGQMGENVTTRGINLLGLPTGTRLHLGDAAVVEVTGLRNPCYQLDECQEGLMKAVLDKDEQGNLIRKAGIMGIVLLGGDVHANDSIRAELPPKPHEVLKPV